MTFKEFTTWCNERACDGQWGMLTAMVCIDLMAEIRKIPFWKRERVWRERYEKQVLAEIVEPINQKIIIDQLAARILQMNVDKLKARYPDGFSTEQSQ